MPRYITDRSIRLWDMQVTQMFNKCKTLEEKALLSLFWLTGARTGEILSLKPNPNFWKGPEQIQIFMPTKKSGRGAKELPPRTLTLLRPTPNAEDSEVTGLNGGSNPLYIESIVEYVEKVHKEGKPLFTKSVRWAEKVLNRLGEEAIGKKVSAYHFRASFAYHAKNNGASEERIKEWLGLDYGKRRRKTTDDKRVMAPSAMDSEKREEDNRAGDSELSTGAGATQQADNEAPREESGAREETSLTREEAHKELMKKRVD